MEVGDQVGQGVWSGTGPMCDLHQPNFDIDERALGVGIAVLAGAALGV